MAGRRRLYENCLRIGCFSVPGLSRDREAFSDLPVALACSAVTVFGLISEHTLISGHPPHPPFVLVEIIARARRDLCVLAVLMCCIMQSIFDAN